MIGWFVRHVMDAPEWRWMSLYQENCAVTVLRWSSDRPPAMISFNQESEDSRPFTAEKPTS
ncbi:hypothetical protein FHR83_009358 [Actinoplanes campanulatus]|uniref:Uncharacterized protein n=1 Tax=Actinoplanes campanulatus TaxID=113559 RepID=A0A7W5ASI7_9ACTN|nr:hypothetical protein [Actinoplanes campanulatus]GGN52083.1 hypothetical protein GCM10010109_92770 [Actinoplanes campanulatus]GID42711.1 hypothetical protein Aca09nite_92170 [Actinoplanes campanulatus]